MATTVLVTRPALEAPPWIDALRDAGFDARALPLIEIAPVAYAGWLPFFSGHEITIYSGIRDLWHSDQVLALLVLAAQWLVFTPYVGVALVLWWLGVALTFVFSFAALFFMFRGEHVAIEHVTPAQFIPAVGLVVMPLAGAPLDRLKAFQWEFSHCYLGRRCHRLSVKTVTAPVFTLADLFIISF